MHTIAIASQKGGVGKSTLAIHLAVAAQTQGFDTLIADLDEHSQTATEWATERGEETPAVVQVDIEDISALKEQAKSEGFDLLIFDCPPYVNEVVAEVTKLADFTLIPSQPEFPPVRTLARVIDKVAEPYAVVLNACPPKRNGIETGKTKEVRGLLLSNEIPASPVSICRRTDMTDALNSGHSVFEYEPEGKAANEINELFKWLMGEIK